MKRDQIERQAKELFDDYLGPTVSRYDIVLFAIAIHDAVKEEDAKLIDDHLVNALSATICASKVNK